MRRYSGMTSNKKKSVASSFKRHFWLPAVIAIFLLKGQLARGQYSSIDFDQGCVNTCFAGYQTALETYCPGGNEENGVYDCAATSCDITKQTENMYVAGYMMQAAKTNNTFCTRPAKNSTTSSTVVKNSSPVTTQTLAPTVVKIAKPVASSVVASTNTSSDADAIQTGADGKPVEKPKGGALRVRAVSEVRLGVVVVQLVLVGVGMTMLA